MSLANWIFWPQLIGVLLFIIGLITFYFPPKRINKYYGYRLPSAIKNQETWDEANHYWSVYMIKCGLGATVTGILITVLLKEIPMPFKIKEALTILPFMFIGLITGVLPIVATEKHMEKTFNKPE